MAGRKPLSKKIRFEVFKRDKFTCQYCGKSAPDVVLEVDHIKPVSKGGSNDILNLITSCRDCNRGKSAIELSDDSTIKKQQKQLQELAERNEQLKMMIEWREGLKNEVQMMIDAVVDSFESSTNRIVTDDGRKTIRKWIKEFSLEEVLDAVDIATQYYPPETAFGKISGICYLTRKRKQGDGNKDYYANYLLKAMRMNNWYYFDERKVRRFVFDCLNDDEDFDRARYYCLDVRNWTEFKNAVEQEFNYFI